MTTSPTRHAPPAARRDLRASPALVDTRLMAVMGGTLAALLAGGGMLVLRSVLQVRTVPERVMEWLLLFVPLGVFEALLQRFGFDAKRYALWLAVVVMPVTSAGLFAADLLDGKLAAIGGYLAVGLTYAATLAAWRFGFERRNLAARAS